MSNVNRGVYEGIVDISKLVEEGDLDSYFYMEDLKARRLTLNTDVDQYTVDEIVRHIFRYNREDAGVPVEQRKPIILYISSCGGELDSGFELIDVIESSKTPVYTVNTGYQYSMAFLIGLCGHKRYTLKNSKFLMHDGSGLIMDSGSKMQDQARFLSAAEQKVKEYVISHTKITSREYSKNQRTEWYMFATDAKEKGVVDYIVGVDCDIDEII